MYDDRVFDRETYYRIWAGQLIKEFESICYNFNIDLSLPAFEIIRTKKVMGAWLSDSRTIQISYFLICDHSWQVVLNVLKHEMAHQICSDLFNNSQGGHGADFQKACVMLGLPDEYRGASGDLPDMNFAGAETVLTKDGRKFIDKVEKLLALAKSDNENEAVLAMQKANELIEKYNLGHSQGQEYSFIVINTAKKKVQRFQRMICGILRDFFFVKVVYSFVYAPWQDCYLKTIELFGRVENITIAEYSYHFLENKLASLWLHNKGCYSGNGLRAKNSYYLGVLNGFKKKLALQRQVRDAEKSSCDHDCTVSGDTRSLQIQNMVEAESRQLSEYIGLRYPRLRTYRPQPAKVYADSFDAGVKAGKQINIHKGVDRQDGNKGKLLGR